MTLWGWGPWGWWGPRGLWGPWVLMGSVGRGWEVSALPTQISPLEPIEPTRTYRPQILHQNPRNHHPLTFNYLPSEYKHDSFELRFTPSLNFEATGERVPFSMLKERNEEKEAAEAERIALVQSLRDEGKSYREIAEMTDLSAATVCRILQKVS